MGRYLIIPFVAVIICIFGGVLSAILGEIVLSIPANISWDMGLIIGLILGILFLRKATGLHLPILPAKKDGYRKVIEYSLLAALSIIVVNLSMEYVQSGGFSFGYEPQLPKTGDVFGLLSVLIFAPVLEELFFTGYLYVYIRDNIGIGAAVTIVSVLFYFGHEANSLHLMTSFLLIYVFEKTSYLSSSIFTHMIWNTYVVLSNMLPE